ncbi:thioredoxin family protein [Candidatus Bipolaricaulota bacterium]|nr:thioredoxin family protein [Candidatus Bipolaricaulota bacterium]MCK4681983.1 thioredoxin family protein [Candidatus Bipolaricaulota bacterium]
MRKIEVFGSGCLMGCSTCKISLDDINHVLTELGLEARVIRVDDIGEAQARGVRKLPALVVDGTIKSEGKSLTVGEIKVFLQEGGIE